MCATDNIKHLFYMNLALEQAKYALSEEEVPVGAIIVDDKGTVISSAHNRAEHMGCQIGHAEILAIAEACKVRGDWRLDDCSIYVTLEPCLMCFGLINLSRLKAVFFGASSPLFGCGIDNKEAFSIYKEGLLVKGGLGSKESARLLKRFFEERRNGREESVMENRDSFLRKMKERLLSKRAEFSAFLKKMSEEGSKRERQIMDSADEASALNMENLQSSIQNTEISEAKLIEEALLRIDKGEYGVCISCGKPISDTRLEHSPYAARCISCQETHES
ncbi:TraR/DksA C4-type zinc finger protein [Candidatus Babeliales bacterium]|nr:TraR/DksA C4-type zinc finger protein [Candidatus Babeliales bacterium]